MSPARDWPARCEGWEPWFWLQMMSLAQNGGASSGYYGFVLFDHFISEITVCLTEDD